MTQDHFQLHLKACGSNKKSIIYVPTLELSVDMLALILKNSVALTELGLKGDKRSSFSIGLMLEGLFVPIELTESLKNLGIDDGSTLYISK